MTIYDRSVREMACRLFERGLGYKAAARRLGIPPRAVRKWQQTYRAVGRGGLLGMGRAKARYDYGTKVAAARAVVDGGMSKPEAMERFGVFCQAVVVHCGVSFQSEKAGEISPFRHRSCLVLVWLLHEGVGLAVGVALESDHPAVVDGAVD